MAREVKITFYEIPKCGYYKRGEDLPIFGNLPVIIDEISEWATTRSMPVEDTCTFPPDERGAFLRTFFFNAYKNNSNHYLITTWDESPSHEGALASINGQQEVGEQLVSLSEFPENNIPGVPFYFWVIPNANLIATIQMDGLLNGMAGFRRLMKGYLVKMSSFVVTGSQDDNQTNIVGYRQDTNSEPQNYIPSFRTSLFHKPGNIRLIKDHRSNIKSIIRKNKLSMALEDDKNLISSMIKGLIGESSDRRATHENKIKYEIDMTPSEEELQKIIDVWENDSEDTWSDVGFTFHGASSRVFWLSHSWARGFFNLDLRFTEEGILVPESFFSAISNQYQHIIGLTSQ